AYISTPNVLTLAAGGAERSDNPWHLREYRADEFEQLCRASFREVALLGLFHARKLALHDAALAVGWDALHRRLGITRAFYGRFLPAISSRDFALRRGAGDPGRKQRLDRALDFLALCAV
ncbi:MAG: class I SAM-dependent methyltransferase, partial [Solirubrobacterales bacterium]|nr:class I SAM-dependent methyltransferase [Solirubrobacterales bacterium]